MTDREKAVKALTCATAILIFSVLLLNPDLANQSAKQGISFCINTIIPSLFVFMVLSKMFSGSIYTKSGRLLPYTLIIGGIISGFPLGTMNIRKMYESGNLNKKQSELLISCANNPSASFIVSFAGSAVVGSVKAGMFLLAGKLLVTLTWYSIASRVLLTKEERRYRYRIATERCGVSEAIYSSAVSMAGICGCIIFFMCIGDLMCSMLSSDRIVKSIVHGFCEFSGGLSLCSNMKPSTAYIISSMLLGWSGMCVHMQISITAGKNLNLKLYFLNRIAECALMGIYGVLTKGFIF